ncbi:hypothetical protein SCLCIDRAFT_27593 [Scleroderma citrinum Foug A]|uniref:Uncharacterized protein n=1 Tax=Scleroderma citrinum Foug A TaxID=1036808 RepID=A0A0C3DSP3_9AGAM|nr:hypothetical protein SCLCIDRAFT_27593 [Scleroderma citrinum Foug A]
MRWASRLHLRSSPGPLPLHQVAFIDPDVAGTIRVSLIEYHIPQLKNLAVWAVHADTGLPIFGEAQEDALERFGVKFVTFLNSICFMRRYVACKGTSWNPV